MPGNFNPDPTQPLHVTVIQADDWGGIYLNGDLWTEGHSIQDRDWMELLSMAGVTVVNKRETPEAYAAIEAEGRCPATWPVLGGPQR